MTTTVDTTLGYAGEAGNFTSVKAIDTIIGPTTAHEGITTATIAAHNIGNIWNLTNDDSGKVITIGVTAATLVCNLPDPSPGVQFDFVCITALAFAVRITPKASGQLTGGANVGSGYVFAATAPYAAFTATAGVGDHLSFKGYDGGWLVSGGGKPSSIEFDDELLLVDNVDITLTAQDAGKLILIPVISQPTTVTLPSPVTAGLGTEFRFITTGTNSANLTIDCGLALLNGHFACGADGAPCASTGDTPAQNVLLSDAILQGVIIHIISDGTLWNAEAITHTAADMTFFTP